MWRIGPALLLNVSVQEHLSAILDLVAHALDEVIVAPIEVQIAEQQLTTEPQGLLLHDVDTLDRQKFVDDTIGVGPRLHVEVLLGHLNAVPLEHVPCAGPAEGIHRDGGYLLTFHSGPSTAEDIAHRHHALHVLVDQTFVAAGEYNVMRSPIGWIERHFALVPQLLLQPSAIVAQETKKYLYPVVYGHDMSFVLQR
jgi:hypothetical protein